MTLVGVNTGNNVISGILADNGGGKLALAMAGSGMWGLGGANTFSGNTTVSGGKLILQNSAALQMSTLSLAIDNGVAFAAGLGSATLGGLAGSGKLALQDQSTSPAGVNVLVGNNGTSTSYGGVLSGCGKLDQSRRGHAHAYEQQHVYRRHNNQRRNASARRRNLGQWFSCGQYH